MLGLQYATTIKQHWKKHHPKMVAELVEAGTLDHEAQMQSRRVAEQVASLKASGMTDHEAEETVRDMIYLRPET